MTPWTITNQAGWSLGFSGQEYWNGLQFPSPEDLPNPGIEPGSSTLQADSLTSEPPGKPKHPTVYKSGVCVCVCVYMGWSNFEIMSLEKRLKDYELFRQVKTACKEGYHHTICRTGG